MNYRVLEHELECNVGEKNQIYYDQMDYKLNWNFFISLNKLTVMECLIAQYFLMNECHGKLVNNLLPSTVSINATMLIIGCNTRRKHV